jgi:hypothetical protein
LDNWKVEKCPPFLSINRVGEIMVLKMALFFLSPSILLAVGEGVAYEKQHILKSQNKFEKYF